MYGIIADLDCRFFSDKFIGTPELLGVWDYPAQLPTYIQDACLRLAERRLKANDINSILLRPSDEPIYEKVTWVESHQLIQKNMWGWGTHTNPPDELPQLQGHAVRRKLEPIGPIINGLSWNALKD